MKVSCLQENLSKGLGIVGRAVASRTTLPITNNVMIATDQSRLKLVATNLEMAISCWIGAKVEEEGAITIPAKLLTDFVMSLPNDKVELSLSPRTKQLAVKCARFEAKISGLDARDFPPIPKVEGDTIIKLDAEELRHAIAQVAFAAATEESRPVLTGVDIQIDGDTMTLAAADGFRLAVHKLKLSAPAAQKVEAIIPARSLAELNRLMGEQDEPVEAVINPGKSQALFRLKNVELVSQLVQGNFPNYSQLIPQSNTSKAIVGAGDFLRATRIASTFARDGSGIVRLIITPGTDLTPGKMVVSGKSEEIAEDTGDIDATVVGQEAKIAFNGKYISDMLGVIKEAQISLETTSSSSPGVLRPVGSDNYTYVVMPMFVQW